MAQRDRSQGFGFVYVDLSKLLAQRDQWKTDFTGTLNSGDTPVINFNKDPELAKLIKDTDQTGRNEPAPEKAGAIHQIRQNLDRLQSLHHKLHAMLEELNSITGTKKKQ